MSISKFNGADVNDATLINGSAKAKINGTALAASQDPDVTAYITAASISDGTEIAAIEQLFSDLKGTGSTTNNSNIYSKFYALYPISPTGISAGAVNAVNPGTYDITWYNSPTYDTTGITGNGLNAYGDTGFNPSTAGASFNDFGLTCDVASTDSANRVDMGLNNFPTNTAFFQINMQNGSYTYIAGNLSSTIAGTVSTLGVRTISRRASNDLEGYLNGSSNGTDTTLNNPSFPSLNIFLMASNQNGTNSTPTARRYRFFAIHTGLSGNQAQDLYDAITTYNANVIGGGR